jgi:hypothetical protein
MLNSYLSKIFITTYDPNPEPPPFFEGKVELILNYLAWGAGLAAVGSIIWIAVMMMVGRRNRSQMAADGMAGLPWVAGGLILVSAASAITDLFLG